jgi:hypothetical protein
MKRLTFAGASASRRIRLPFSRKRERERRFIPGKKTIPGNVSSGGEKKVSRRRREEDEILLSFRCALLSEGEKRNLRRGKSDSSLAAACEFLLEIINFLFSFHRASIFARPEDHVDSLLIDSAWM